MLQIDTGSSDIWIPWVQSNACTASRRAQTYCQNTGAFDPSASSTFRSIRSGFKISYVDGSAISGDYIADTFGMGSIDVRIFEFACFPCLLFAVSMSCFFYFFFFPPSSALGQLRVQHAGLRNSGPLARALTCNRSATSPWALQRPPAEDSESWALATAKANPSRTRVPVASTRT